MRPSKISLITLPALVAALNILIIIFPRQSLAAARDGLSLWATSVLPGVLPFVIGANLLMALGAVSFLGTALTPVMRAVFKLPGVGGFALAIGLVSGYPIGAKVVCEMRSKGDLSRGQAQRLIAFANNAGPLFILGAVAAGMFGSSHLGYFMLAVHYAGAMAIGLLMRLFAPRGKTTGHEDKQYPLHIMALRAMETARRKDGRSFGQAFGQAVLNAVETMLLIGGFIMLFSVVSTILGLVGVYSAAAALLAPLLQLASIPPALHEGLFVGLVEMTNGLGLISQQGISRSTVALASGILGFSGMSILFQSISFIGKTDISATLFALTKAAHGLLSALLAAALYPLFNFESPPPEAVTAYSHTAATRLAHSAAYFAITIAALLILSTAIILAKKVKK